MGERERISMSQKQYLHRLHRRQTWILAFRLLLSVTFLALWESAVRLHWIDGFIFSSPYAHLWACGGMAAFSGTQV